VALMRAVILTHDEEDDLLGLLHSFHAVRTEAHDRPAELGAFHRLRSGEKKIAEAHRLVPSKLSIGYTRDKAGDWRVSASYPLTSEEEGRVRGIG
jgi:hypothetical protein